MSFEHRMQHAARELREVDVVVPPLGSVRAATAPKPVVRLAVLVAPVLFVLGGLVMTTGALRQAPDTTDAPATPASALAVDPAPVAGTTAGPDVTTPGEELELIALLVADAARHPSRARPVLSPGPLGVV